ncbi:MAG: shikimate dehydrogenase [Hyphomonas sp.]|uniref:shikimate dehydrogenase n=1 Tax=Hyphomonas sp. TaxID=87 RepID=UPI0018243E0A|nr:shikimate dehydrogenase [Hyphomonas sp.]MBU3921102.1 shikimate dehydrogenase [Alphaproteobacteria bacterium]MBA3070470.1 shikimate dehydrogenase [Hyphomonas sp.]MBU4062000.1 shikimate dehydrogenase [Alphaproteobacteria bacterium]MBU4164936.1 shikimate dehydrogenase [Alphaproteobacteria bacterium]MBU4567851.1 shikimate dehydrogenase [Alphaproteobacteria bacterium]
MRRLLGVIGDPVAHSLSPYIHNHWLRENEIDAVYAALEVKSGELAAALTSLLNHGAAGLNVTLPHKEDALRLASSVGDTARRIGAANTLVRTPAGEWRAENTDAPGFALTLDYGDIAVEGRDVFLLGAGGAARAVADVLTRRGARLTLCNRTIARAEALALDLAPAARILSLDEGLKQLPKAAVVINTLSLGHAGGVLELPASAGGIFYDISYGKGAAASLAEASRKGWRTLDGLGMLVAQAALSFELWFGITPDLAAAHARARTLLEAVQ